MSLREECLCSWFDEIDGLNFDQRMDRVINKILDAAVEAVDSCKSTVYIDGKLEYVVIPLAQAKARINKLRGEE